MDWTPKRSRITGPVLEDGGAVRDDLGSTGEASPSKSRKRSRVMGPREKSAAASAVSTPGNGREGLADEARVACASSAQEAGGDATSKPRERCSLLEGLPMFGTLTRVNRAEVAEMKSRTLIVPTLVPTYNTLHPRCRTVKSDDTNILVRALRIKKRKQRENKRRMLLEEATRKKRVAASSDCESVASGSASAVAPNAPCTPLPRKRPRTAQHRDSPTVDTRGLNRGPGNTASSSPSSASATRSPGASASKPEESRRLSCTFSPRLGASRVQTPPPGARRPRALADEGEEVGETSTEEPNRAGGPGITAAAGASGQLGSPSSPW